MKKCCFFGHSQIYDKTLMEKLHLSIKMLIEDENTEMFMVGNYGDFDRRAALALKQTREKYPHIKSTLVIPYLTKSINDNHKEISEIFTDVVVADIPENIPARLKIIKANEYMIDNSEFAVCYVDRLWGGAAKTLEYAKRKHIMVYNLTDIIT